MPNNKKSKFDYLIEFLENECNGVGPWIHRKEIAVWSAVVLYLTGLSVVTDYVFKNNFNESIMSSIIFIIFLLTMLCFFIYFIVLQFGYISNAMVFKKALNIWIISMMQREEIPKEFRFEFDKSSISPLSVIAVQKCISHAQNYRSYIHYIPEEIIKDIKNFKTIRRSNFCCRFFLPYKHILQKLNLINSILPEQMEREDTHIEREEAIIYNLLVWPTIFIVIYYCLLTCSKLFVLICPLFFLIADF